MFAHYTPRSRCRLIAPLLALAIGIFSAMPAFAEFFDNFEWREVNHGVGITKAAIAVTPGRVSVAVTVHRGQRVPISRP